MSSMIALSFSRLSDYEACPLKFKLKYITKEFPDDSNNPAFVKGNIIHKQLEDYINYLKDNGSKPSMNAHTTNAIPILEGMHKASNGNIFAEKQIATNQEWLKCDWFDKPHIVKYRAIIDCLVFLDKETLLIVDFKSGKVRDYEDGPTTQLKLTAAMLFSLYPKINKITSSYLFVEHKKTIKVEFSRDQLESIKSDFDNAHTIVNQDGDFEFKKNQYCNWCAATSGQCPVKK